MVEPRWYEAKEAWLGLVFGTGLGIFDFWALQALGVTIQGPNDAGLFVMVYFALSFGFLCGLVGYIAHTRKRLRRKNETIEAQYAELKATQKRAAENEKLATIGRLAACVAHEVRNPLGVIRTSASMMLEDYEPGDERSRAGEMICEEVVRLDSFCTALLNFSRPIALSKAPTELAELIQEIQQMEREEKAAKILAQTEAPLSAVVDRHLLKQALLSLVNNALQSLGSGGGQVALRLKRGEPQRIWIEVADDGEGISEDISHRVFEPFFTTKATGTGLGLSMAERVVEAHDGSVEIVQGCGVGAQGAGACIRIILPMGAPS